MNNNVKGALAIGLFIALIALFTFCLPKLQAPPGPPTPTPLPTTPALTHYKVRGGLMLLDKEVVQYLKDNYYIDVNETMQGSFTQAEGDLTGVDCTWPAGFAAVDYYRVTHPTGDKFVAKNVRTIFQSPLVVYSWRQYLPTLQKAGLVNTTDGKVYSLKMRPIVDAMVKGKNWKDIGVDIDGPVFIETTDPIKSGSGMGFMGMFADYLVEPNGGKVVNVDQIGSVLPSLYKYWQAAGRQIDNSPALFQKFLRTGAGLPMVGNYESAFMEFYAAASDSVKKEANEVVGLYPEITVNTEHAIIGITPGCDDIIDVFANDEHLKEIAWSKYGLRNGEGGITSRPGDPTISWVSATYRSMPEPVFGVIKAIREGLR